MTGCGMLYTLLNLTGPPGYLDDRYGHSSTMVITQIPVEGLP